MKVAKEVLGSGLFGAFIEGDICQTAIEQVEETTSRIALFCEEIEEKVKEIANGESDSVH